jgi:hypothetical protein
MPNRYLLIAAAAALTALPANAQNNMTAANSDNAANMTVANGVTDANAVTTAAPANALEPAPPPAASDLSTRAAAKHNRERQGFPFGIIGLVGLIGLLGRRRGS